MAAVARSAVVVFVLATIIAACGDDGTATTTTATASAFPPVTHTMAPSYVVVAAWDPADEIPTDLEAGLTTLLRSNGDWMLLPSAPPIEGPTSAEVITLTPGNDPMKVTYNVVVRPAGSGAVLLSLSNTLTESDPCSDLSSEYASIAIRGVEGCARMVDNGVDFLHWGEDGRWFSVEWDNMDLAGVVSWLETWRRIP